MKADRASLRAVPTKVPLSQQERAELAARWDGIVCAHCGQGHGGTCPRVKRIRTSRLPNGATTTDIEYWAENKWSPHPDAIAPADVFPGGVPSAPIDASSVEKRAKKKGPKA